MKRSAFLLSVLLLACGDDDVTTDAGGPGTDSGARDSGMPTNDSGPPTDGGGTSDAGADAGMMAACGDMRPDISGIRGTEGLVIARDGTIYYSQDNAVGRLEPGGAADDAWADLGGAADTVWGLALSADNATLYAASPSAGAIFSVDTATAAVATYLPGAGAPNGLTLGPDGALYYSNFGGGHVFRVPAMGMRTQVTTSTIMQPNGVAFGPDGRLYVESYATGVLFALTLRDGMEDEREMFAMGLGNPDGIAFDEMGRIYVGDNGGGRLLRLEADGTGGMSLRTGIPAAANVEFGAGALNCNDIYVASSGALVRYEMGDTPGYAVPWH
jgi:sugar lactone lactonase YvrE